MSNQAGRYQRSFPGMIGALGVLLLVVLAFVLVRASVREDLETPLPDVDYASSLGFFEQQTGFPIVAPATLPEGWQATSARVEPGPPITWHLGLLTDDEKYVGLEQAQDSDVSMVAAYVDEDATEEGAVDIDGVEWTAYSDEGGDQALVRTEGELTTLVVGTVDQGELIDFVRSLR